MTSARQLDRNPLVALDTPRLCCAQVYPAVLQHALRFLRTMHKSCQAFLNCVLLLFCTSAPARFLHSPMEFLLSLHKLENPSLPSLSLLRFQQVRYSLQPPINIQVRCDGIVLSYPEFSLWSMHACLACPMLLLHVSSCQVCDILVVRQQSVPFGNRLYRL